MTEIVAALIFQQLQDADFAKQITNDMRTLHDLQERFSTACTEMKLDISSSTINDVKQSTSHLPTLQNLIKQMDERVSALSISVNRLLTNIRSSMNTCDIQSSTNGDVLHSINCPLNADSSIRENFVNLLLARLQNINNISPTAVLTTLAELTKASSLHALPTNKQQSPDNAPPNQGSDILSEDLPHGDNTSETVVVINAERRQVSTGTDVSPEDRTVHLSVSNSPKTTDRAAQTAQPTRACILDINDAKRSFPGMQIDDDFLNGLKAASASGSFCSDDELRRGVSDETLRDRNRRASSSPPSPFRAPVGDCIRSAEDVERLVGMRLAPSSALERSLRAARMDTADKCNAREISNNESDETRLERLGGL